MAYSMFECPKLQNAKSLKFYSDEYDHHIPFRHKKLHPEFKLEMNHHHIKNMKNRGTGNFSLCVQNSTHRKCPIYVHNISSGESYNDGDFVPTGNKSRCKQKSVIKKLEESYWANWKPDKHGSKNFSFVPRIESSKFKQVETIKSAPIKKKKIKVIKVYPDSDDEVSKKETQIKRNKSTEIQTKLSKSQEIQTEDFPEKPLSDQIQSTIIEEKDEELKDRKEEKSEEKTEIIEVPEIAEPEDVVMHNKFLKHTDSFILNVKKQKEEKEHFDQPKCIRLYRKPKRNASKNYVKGGSYPLKSCLKKESSLSKPPSKLGRPGSPIIVSSSLSTRSKIGKNRHL